MPLFLGVNWPKSMFEGDGVPELLVEVEVQAFHVPELSVMFAVIFSEGTVVHEGPSCSVSE